MLCCVTVLYTFNNTHYSVYLIILKTLCSTAVDGYMSTSRLKWRFPTTQIQVKMSWFPVSLTLILAQLFLFTKRLECCQKKAHFPLCIISIFPFHTKQMEITSSLQCMDINLAVLFKGDQMNKI